MAEHSFDLVVVGAGASGLLAAIAARRLGRNVLVVEATALAGGSTAGSDGKLWLPANPLQAKLGVTDSAAEAIEYLDAVLGATTDASTTERRTGYANLSGKIARWLVSSHVPLAVVKTLPDHHPDLPGGKAKGRVLATQPLDRRTLGDNAQLLAPSEPARRGPLGLIPSGLPLPLPRNTETSGEALVGNLLHRALANGVQLWLESPVVSLLSDDQAVTGVRVRRGTGEVDVAAEQVLLASGGYEHSQDLREEYLPLPTSAEWSVTGVPNDGALLAMATALGAGTALLTEAWWTPVMISEGRAYRLDSQRGKPHSLIVDTAGDRYFDEATFAHAAGRALYDRNRGVRAVPSYLIMDNRHRQAHPLGPWPAGKTPKQAIEAGEIFKAATLNDLAQATGIDRAGLLGTVVRFNGFAAKNNDPDFGRGASIWDLALGDHTSKKATSVGKLDKQPFWAVPVYPGDSGTKGGLLIDADSRVLRTDGSAIAGLYACGGAAASLFKSASPAPGVALGAALVEAFAAATDQRLERRRES